MRIGTRAQIGQPLVGRRVRDLKETAAAADSIGVEANKDQIIGLCSQSETQILTLLIARDRRNHEAHTDQNAATGTGTATAN
ncbi:hypothetical protein ACLKA7_016336 [Drosophila subpalustris]